MLVLGKGGAWKLRPLLRNVVYFINSKSSFQTTPLTVETVGLDAETAPTTNCQTPNCTNYYEKPTVPLVVEQLVGAPLPTLTYAMVARFCGHGKD